jgi:hypothetical protein
MAIFIIEKEGGQTSLKWDAADQIHRFSSSLP